MNQDKILERALGVLARSRLNRCEFVFLEAVNLGEILNLTHDAWQDRLCIYIVTDDAARYPVYIGSTTHGYARLREHRTKPRTSDLHDYLLALGDACHRWNVLFIEQVGGTRGDLIANEGLLIRKLVPYLYASNGLPDARVRVPPCPLPVRLLLGGPIGPATAQNKISIGRAVSRPGATYGPDTESRPVRKSVWRTLCKAS